MRNLMQFDAFTHPFWDVAAALEGERAKVEIMLIREVFCDHKLGVPLSKREGVHSWLFSHDDLKVIFDACDVCAAAGASQATLLRILPPALSGRGHWNPQGPIPPPFTSRWSDEALVILAASRRHSLKSLRHHARKLIELDRRQRQAAEHLRAAYDLLTGEPPYKVLGTRVRFLPPLFRGRRIT